MIKAYVLMVTAPGKTRGIVEQLAAMDAVQEVHEVMGPYDIVAEISASTLGDIAPLLSGQIRSIQDVLSTTTLVAFSEE